MPRSPSASPTSSQSRPRHPEGEHPGLLAPASCAGTPPRPGSRARPSPIWRIRRPLMAARWTPAPCVARSAGPPAGRRYRRCCGSPPPAGRAGSRASPAEWIRFPCPPPAAASGSRAAEQKAGPLGAVQPLVARHGDKGRPQFLQMDRAGSPPTGRRPAIRGTPRSRHRPGDLLHGEDKAEHIGYMGTYSRVHPLVQGLSEGLYQSLRPKERAAGHPDLHIRDGVERPGDRVVLIAGDHHSVPRTDQGLYGDIQSVGGVKRKDHLFRLWCT